MATSTDRPDHPAARRTLRTMASDMPIGRKLFAAFTLLAIVLGMVIGGLLWTVDDLSAADHQIVAVASERSEAAEQLKFAAADLRAAQEARVIGGVGSKSGFEEATSNFERTLEVVRNKFEGPVATAL